MRSGDLKDLFAVDLRSLALCRIGFGVIVIIDAINRLQLSPMLYSIDGLLPPDYARAMSKAPWLIPSLWNDSLAWQQAILLLLLVSGFALAAGFQQRLIPWVTWFLFWAATTRVPGTGHGGDKLLPTALLFIGFLPSCGLLTFMRKNPSATGAETTNNKIFSSASAGLVLLVALLYYNTACLKVGPAWWPLGTASQDALSNEIFRAPYAAWLLQYPGFLKLTSYAVLLLEYTVPVFLFMPWWNAAFRMFAVAALTIMHLAFSQLMVLWTFPWIDIAFLAAFIPPAAWDRIFKAKEETVFSPNWRPGWLSNVVAGTLTAMLTVLTLMTAAKKDTHIPQWLANTADVALFSYRWPMFSPQPPTTSRRIAIELLRQHEAPAYAVFDHGQIKWSAEKSTFQNPSLPFRISTILWRPVRSSSTKLWSEVTNYFCRQAPATAPTSGDTKTRLRFVYLANPSEKQASTTGKADDLLWFDDCQRGV